MAKVNPVLFLRQVRQEINKVSWPTQRETLVTSMMVFIISVIAALFFLAVDGLIASTIGMILK